MTALPQDEVADLGRLVAELEQRLESSFVVYDQAIAQQAALTRENARLTSELATALDREAASTEILRTISEVSGDAERSLQQIVEITARLFGASSVRIRLAGTGGGRSFHVGRSSEAILATVPGAQGHIGGRNLPGTVLAENRQIHVADLDHIDPDMADWPGLPVARAAGTRTISGTPLRREGNAIGALIIHRDTLLPFTEAELALQQSFADQAAVAVENARLFNEAREALERQTATADILQVIAGSPSDVRPIFDAIVKSAANLFGPCGATITTLKDGKLYWNATGTSLPGFDFERAKAVYPIPFDPERSPSARAILERRIIEIPDVDASDTPHFTRQAAAAGGFKSITFVPLVSRDQGIGSIILNHPQAGFRLSDHQLALIQTFADQAVIAIENARLFNETREALERQTATSDILKVIASSPSDVQPVFDAIAQTAVRLLDCDVVGLLLCDGDFFSPAAEATLEGLTPNSTAKNVPIDPAANFPSRVIVEKKRLHLPDYSQIELPEHEGRIQSAIGVQSALFLPLLREDNCIGVLALTCKQPRTFSDSEIALAESYRDQAVIAIENVRLFDEVQARTNDLSESLEQQTATAEVLKVISRSTFDLQTVLETLIISAVELSGAYRGSIFLREGDVFPLKAASSTTPEFLQYWAAHPPRAGRGSATERVIASGKIEEIPDVRTDPEMQMTAGALVNIRATLGVPMLRDNKVEGVLVLTRPEPGHFTKSQIDLVQTFADQAVIAVENVRLFDEAQARTRELAASLEELRTAQDRLVQTEKLASLGQLTAGIAHEIKNPLNFVNNFSSLSAELTDELNDVLKTADLADKMREEVDELTGLLKDNLQKVVQHGQRADSIVKNMLLHSREGSGDHRPADINALLDESLNLAYHGARAEKPQFNVTLQRDFDPNAGLIELFPQEITRVFLNLIGNGFYAVAKRKLDEAEGFDPVVSASTRNLGDHVEIRIHDNGTGIPPEVKDKMFNPFFTTKPAGEGTGLGLSMSHDIIVKQHGGTIDVATEPGQFTEFTVRLPRTGHSAHKK